MFKFQLPLLLFHFRFSTFQLFGTEPPFRANLILGEPPSRGLLSFAIAFRTVIRKDLRKGLRNDLFKKRPSQRNRRAAAAATIGLLLRRLHATMRGLGERNGERHDERHYLSLSVYICNKTINN